MANRGRTRRTRNDTEETSKAQGDDQGGAWEINDSARRRKERDEESRHSRNAEKHQGKAWRINENTEGS